MAGATLTTADAVLKDIYEGQVNKQINDANFITTIATKNKKDFVGRRAIHACHMTRNTGVGARLENEVMPAAGNQGTVDQFIYTRGMYGRYRLTRQVIAQMASDQGSFVRAVDLEMGNLKDDSARDINRQYWGTSDGRVATCGTTTASTTVQLSTSTPEAVLVGIAEGMRVDIGTVANPQSIASNRKVTAVSFTNSTVTIDGAAVTTSSAAFLFRQGSGGGTAGSAGGVGSSTSQREITGLQSLIDDASGTISGQTTVFGIDASTYWQWASIVETNSGAGNRAPSENLVAKAMHRAQIRSGKDADYLLCEHSTYRAFANVLQAQKRFMNTQDLKGGSQHLEVSAGGKPLALTYDRDCPPNRMYGVNSESLVEHVCEDWQFDSLDGQTLRLANDGTHAYEAIWFSFREFATTRRNAHFAITELETA